MKKINFKRLIILLVFFIIMSGFGYCSLQIKYPSFNINLLENYKIKYKDLTLWNEKELSVSEKNNIKFINVELNADMLDFLFSGASSLNQNHNGQYIEDIIGFLLSIQKEDGSYPEIVSMGSIEMNSLKTEEPQKNTILSLSDQLTMSDVKVFRSMTEALNFYLKKDEGEYLKIKSSVDRQLKYFEKKWVNSDKRSKYDKFCGYKISLWLPDMSPKKSAYIGLGLLNYYNADPNEKIKDMIDSIGEGIADSSIGNFENYPFNAVYLDITDINYWDLTDNVIVSFLSRAGRLFSQNSWLRSAEDESNNMYVHILSSYGSVKFYPAPEVSKQYLSDINGMVSNLMDLYKTTNRDVYSLIAGLSASWLFGNNPSGKNLFEESSQRVFGVAGSDGLNVTGIRDYINYFSVVEKIKGTLAENYINYKEIQKNTFEILEAEKGVPVKTDPVIRNYKDIAEFKNKDGAVIELSKSYVYWHKLEINEDSFYLLYLVHQKEYGFALSTAAGVRVDGYKIYKVLMSQEDTPVKVMAMSRITEPFHFEPVYHTVGIKNIGLQVSNISFVDSLIVQPVVERRFLKNTDDKYLMILKSFSPEPFYYGMDIRNISSETLKIREYSSTGFLKEDRTVSLKDITDKAGIKIMGGGFTIVEY